MKNGFSAADMSTAAANGHAEGYQAGYADAVKAIEAAQPAAAQEAVAWRDDVGNLYPSKESVDKYLPRGRTVHALYAAPVTAAPGVGLEQFREAVTYWRDTALRDMQYQNGPLHEQAVEAQRLLNLIDGQAAASPKGGSEVVSDAMIHAALRVQYARAGSLWTGSKANPDFTDMRHILSAAMQAQAGDAEVQP